MPYKPITISIPLTARQKSMIEHPARILHIGAGTKTGKSVGLAAWIDEGILNGEACAWVGPWFPRARAGYEACKSLIGPLIESGQIKVTDGVLRIRHASGAGSLDVYSADNPQSIFGGNYDRMCLDEASRMPEAIYAAALTTISATNGKLRCAFNLELGSKNWAIRNLLRVQAMSPEKRRASSEDFLTFPSGGDGLVDPALIALLRSQMPEPLWRALYLAEIPESDLSLFRNLDKIFTGHELSEPLPGRNYVAGIDLGRKQDFTVVTIIDQDSGEVVAGDRYHQISWTLQCERAAALAKHFRCGKVFVDTTGLGDPVGEELSKLGVPVEPFIFSAPSRKALLEELIVACDNTAIKLPSSETFSTYRNELQSFEFVLDGSSVKYSAPSNMHDDCVMSLALAVHGWKAAAQRELGVLGWLKAIDKGIYTPDGSSKTLPVELQVTKQSILKFEAEVRGLRSTLPEDRGAWTVTEMCSNCKGPAVRLGGVGVRCNNCGHVDASGLPKPYIRNRGDFLASRLPSARSLKFPCQR